MKTRKFGFPVTTLEEIVKVVKEHPEATHVEIELAECDADLISVECKTIHKEWLDNSKPEERIIFNTLNN